MPKAHVLNEKLSNADRSKIEGLLSQHGYDPDFTYPKDVSALDPEADIGVVCLPIDASEQDAVDEKVRGFAEAGIRVVAIWLHEEGSLPDSIERLGSSAITSGSTKIKEVLDGVEVIWEEPSGIERPQQKVPRNKC